MCRTTAAPLMAMAGVAGTAVGIAFAVIREKADRLALKREIEKEALENDAAEPEASQGAEPDGQAKQNE